MRIVVTGGRDYSDAEQVDRVMNKLVSKYEKPLFINGGAPGLDTLVKDWCATHAVPCFTMFAPWGSKLRRAAGPVRNQWMIDYGNPDMGIVFPGGTGTADMHKKMIAAGLKIKIIRPR